MYDIVIIGAGPAGLTAALYARCASKKTLVLEARSYGGKITTATTIKNYPVNEDITGYEFATKLYNQVKNLGAEIVFEKAIDIESYDDRKEVITDKNRYTTKTIIIATGSDNRKLGLENEDSLVGKGVSYCATCDGLFYKGKDVAVIGGGNTALEEAVYLADICNKVYLIHRRDEFRADDLAINSVKEKENIEIIYNSTVTKINADDVVNSIEVSDKENNTKQINVSGLFIAVGLVPENQNFAKIIEIDKAGYIKAREDCKTNVEGIFVAGDNRVKSLRQLVTAASDGAVAATGAIKYINQQK